MHVDLLKVAPILPSLLTAATLIVYSLLAVNPVMLAVVPCTSGRSPSSGETVTTYPVMVFASPPKSGAFQLILMDDSVTLLMMDELGLSKAEQKIFHVTPNCIEKFCFAGVFRAFAVNAVFLWFRPRLSYVIQHFNNLPHFNNDLHRLITIPNKILALYLVRDNLAYYEVTDSITVVRFFPSRQILR